MQKTFWHSCRTEQIAFHASATRHLLDQGEWLRQRGGPALTVAALDVGAVGYVSDACIIDIHGLTSPDLAGKDRDYAVRYILARKPDYIQVYAHPLLDAPEFKRLYTRVPGIAWHLYQRNR